MGVGLVCYDNLKFTVMKIVVIVSWRTLWDGVMVKKEGALMEFDNLRRNILAGLGKQWRQSKGKRNYYLDGIRSEYSDIPVRDVDGAVQSLIAKGFILLSREKQSIQITPKGLNRLQVIKDRNNNDDVIMAKEID